MDEPIDAVALGLKRGPRGAVAAGLVLVAITLAIAWSRSGPEQEQPAPAAPAIIVEAAPVAPVKRRPVKQQPRARQSAALVNRVAKPEPTPPPPPEALAEGPAERAAPPPPPALEDELPVRPTGKLEDEQPTSEGVAEAPPAPPPEPIAPELPEREGNGEAIARAIAADKRAAVRACFERELKHSPKLRGTVVVELDLGPPNRVNGVRVNDDLERAAFTSCVAATMRDVRFAALDEEISVSVPYVLTPAAK